MTSSAARHVRAAATGVLAVIWLAVPAQSASPPTRDLSLSPPDLQGPSPSLAWQGDEGRRTRIRETIEFMASLGSRVSGYPGSRRASDYVEAGLSRLGLQDLRREEFEVTVPIDLGSRLCVVGSDLDIPVAGLWPNLVRTTTISPEGLNAPLVYGGTGEYAHFNGLDLDGRIVLLEFNSWGHWVRAASLGARAIVFIAPHETSYIQTLGKSLSAPLDIPRFWIDREQGEDLRRRLLAGEQIDARLTSRMEWRSVPAWNIWGTIPGTDPALRDDVIIVEAYYDGMSVAPARAPAAEEASSIAALLELAQHLQAHPPSRTVILLATGGHFLHNSGTIDFLDRHARKLKEYAVEMEEPLHPRLFISLDLSSKTDQIGIWNNTFSFDLKRFFVPFGRRYTAYADEIAPLQGRISDQALVNGISPIKGMDWSTFAPGGVSVDSEMAMAAGQVALAFVTVHDARFPVNTPLDTPPLVRIDNLERQIAFLNALLSKSFGDPELFADLEDFGPVLKDRLRTHKVRVRAFPRRSQIPDRKISNAIVVMGEGSHKGVHWTRYALTNQDGEAEFPGLFVGGTTVGAYVLDPETGDVAYAPDLSTRAEKFHGKPLGSGRLTHAVRRVRQTKPLVLFPCISRPLYGLVHPNFLFNVHSMKVIDRSGVAPRQFGYLFSGMEPAIVVFAPREMREDDGLKMLMPGAMLINSPGGDTEEEARGIGYSLSKDRLIPTEYLAVRDMWRLNDARLRTMRRHAIENQRLTRLHESGRRRIEAAEKAMKDLQWDEYVAQVRAALGVTVKAYPDVVGTLNDVIRGIVFFLALVVPAAFFGERLLLASPDVRWQIAGFGAVLLVIWLVISQVHPAFDIAHPLIILLAFAIMAMACFVLAMVVARFNRYIKEYQAQQARIHETDISRASAAYAAVMLGISNMRRRKLRTGLSLLTITLLTFTVLSFTSFKPEVRFLVFSLDHEGNHEGALIRERGWNPLFDTSLAFARSQFGGQATVAPRNWYIAFDDETKMYTEIKRGAEFTRATGLLGLTPQERTITGVDRCLVSGRFFERQDELSCLLSTDMALALGLDPVAPGGGTVQIFGREFEVCGIFDPEALEAIRDLDNEPLMPVDFQMSSTETLGAVSGPQMAVVEEIAQFEVKPFVHLRAENVVILPYETLREAFGMLRSIGIRFLPGAPGQDLVEDFLVRVDGTLFAGFRDPDDGRIAVSSYTSLGITAVEGIAALVIPMLIAALIILNAMLGAVYERFREIDIYSSVGLAPMHISLLFVAEACVYAVVGVTLGYVLGQGLGKVLVLLGWLRGISLNYSSVSAIISAAMVMAVVLLSTLYPARIAARSAVPDTVRRWRPPPPDGDRWVFEFPFMISEAEVQGVCGFLASFFNAYGEESIGIFCAEKVRITTEELDVAQQPGTGREYAVQLLLWLAPFDMGVSQFLQVEFTPSDIRGAYAIVIYIERISGQDTYWQRVNHRFMNELRREFLIWYTMDADSKAFHRRTAQTMLAAPGAERSERA